MPLTSFKGGELSVTARTKATLGCHPAHSNCSETQTERDRTLFELLRMIYESAWANCTDLSRRLRDGVSLENELVSSWTAPTAQVCISRG